MRGLAVLGLALAGAAWLACGGGGPDADEALRLVADDWSPASEAQRMALRRVHAGRELRLEGARARPSPKGWRVWELREPGGASPLARLALATDEAALLLHAAARARELAFAIAPNRLVRLATRDGERLALWLDAEAEPSLAASADLDLDEAAPLVAAAQALGGWRAVANDRYPVAPDGGARLPLFVPAPLGDWRALRQRSLEFFLPPALGRSFATRPGFRTARDRALAGYAQGLPELAESVARVAENLPEAEHGAVAAALAEQLNESARVLAGYLDSTWIELVIERTGSAAARVRVWVHSVVELRLEALQAELPGKLLVTESASLAGLRLAPVGEGEVVRAHLGQDRLEFRIDRVLTPAARGVETFRTTSLEYALTGLASLGPAAAPLLEGLRVRATNAATGAPVPDSHVHRLSSVAAEGFEIGAEPGIDAFLAALPRVLLRSGGGAPAELRLDRRARMLALPAGDYHVVADFVPPADFGLVLDAGVSLRVDPGRSLLIRGPLEVRGSSEKPVRVLAAQPTAPWGVLALQGRGRSALSAARPRSELRYLELSGGSQDQLKGVSYEGQLSVHHQDFTLQHGVLSRAFAGASLSVEGGRVDLRDSVFVDNQSDAVDLDRAEGRAERCFFGRSGQDGDGLDLTQSSLAVTDSVFSALRDECISLGATSTLQLRGSLLRGCDLGLASRDGSHAEVADSLFLDNQRNFAAVAKREGFGGATIRGRRLLLVAGSKPDARDPASTIELEDATTIAHPEESGLALDALRKAPSFSSARFRTLSPAPR